MKILTVIRLLSFVLFIYHTVTIHVSWSACFSGLLLILTLYVFKDTKVRSEVDVDLNSNPLKGKPRGVTEDSLSDPVKYQLANKIIELITYNARECEAVSEFRTVTSQSECIFAKSALIWGSCDWVEGLGLEGNIYDCVPTLVKFVEMCPTLGLDGFVFMLPGKDFGRNIQVFGEAVRRVLTILSDHDPADVHCMSKTYIHHKGWVFQFNKCTMFVTTFAPFYPNTNSRFNYGNDHCFILLQPELSFAQHDLCPDTPHTNWDDPHTVRDKIRVGFRDAGRGYEIRDTIYYPMVEDIVKPIRKEDELFKWWENCNESRKKNE